MTALWVILGVIAAIIIFIVILLHISVRAYVSADMHGLTVRIKYLWFNLFSLDLPEKKTSEAAAGAESSPKPREDAPEFEIEEIPEVDSTDTADIKPSEKSHDTNDEDKAEESKESGSDEEDSQDASEKPEAKPTLLEMWNEYKKYIPAGKKAFRKLLKLIRFYGLNISLKIGNEDPYKAGVNFGRLNALFYNALALLCCLFSVKIEHTEISCDFEKKVTEFSLKTGIYVRPSAVLALAAYVGIYYLKIRKSMEKLKNNAEIKAKENDSDE